MSDVKTVSNDQFEMICRLTDHATALEGAGRKSGLSLKDKLELKALVKELRRVAGEIGK